MTQKPAVDPKTFTPVEDVEEEAGGHVHGPGCSHDHGHSHDHVHHHHHQAVQPFVRATAKVGRNDPCSCGSGVKFKKCCGKN